MKKSALPFFVLAVGLSAQAQKVEEKNVPSVVKTEFKKKFPMAKALWSLDEGNYEAKFDLGKEKKEAVLDKEGKWLKVETEMPSLNSLPAPVLTAFKKSPYANHKFKQLEKIETAEGKVSYEVEVTKDETLYELFYSEEGALLETKKEKTDDEKD